MVLKQDEHEKAMPADVIGFVLRNRSEHCEVW